MMKVRCFEAKAIVCGNNYFNGGNGQAYNYKTECFATREEAEAGLAKMRKETEERMAWCNWWIKEYVIDENFTITEVTKEF